MTALRALLPAPPLCARRLPFLTDLYVLAMAVLTCILELEINSPLIRDHLALPIERSLAFLRLASGRGVLYCAAGLLAVDISAKESEYISVQAISGCAMLLFGAANLFLGSIVAVKLKRLRRQLAGPAALRTAYRSAILSAPPYHGRSAHEAQGLSAVTTANLLSSLGVHGMGRYQLQAVFLEIDGPRRGMLTESSLLVWYYGHIGRHLKKLILKRPPCHRSLKQWLLRWPEAALDLSTWAALVCTILVPSSLVAIVHAVAQRSLIELVMNLYLCVLSSLMLVLEVKDPGHGRTIALHLLRYASALMHPTARGVVYLLFALSLLTQDATTTSPYFWGLGIAVEALGFAYIFVGWRVNTTLRRLRKALPDRRQISAAFRAVSPDELPIRDFGLRLLCTGAGVPLRWRFEQEALLTLFDLDRDGAVTCDDLLYWLSADFDEATEEEEEEAEAQADSRAAGADGGGDGDTAAGAGAVAANVSTASVTQPAATGEANAARNNPDAELRAAEEGTSVSSSAAAPVGASRSADEIVD